MKKNGQVLVEVLLALGFAAVIITGLVFAVISALNNAQFSRNQNLATQYAQQGMEIVRAIRDSTRWSDFVLLPQKNCLAKNSADLVLKTGPSCPQNVDLFVREVDIKKNDPDCKPDTGGQAAKVTVIVAWQDGKCPGTFCHQAKLISCFTNTNTVSTP